MKKLLLILFLFSSYCLNAQTCITNSSSVSFNGSSSYVSFSSNNNLAPDTAVTVEAWINASTWASNPYNGSIFCKHSWSANEQGFVLRAGGAGQLSFILAGIDTAGGLTSWVELLSATNALTLNTWYHVAGSYDGDTMRIFINGVKVGQKPLKGTLVPATLLPPAIGRLSFITSGQTRYWNGKIDEVRVWGRALLASEILSRYNDHMDPSLQTGLIGYWRLNENTGTFTADLSPSGNDGTLNGPTWSTQVPFTNSAVIPFVVPNGTLLTSTPAVTYQWNYNGVAILNATSQTYVAVQNGNHSVTITDSLSCTATSVPYFVTAVVGLDEVGSNGGFRVEKSFGEINLVSSNKLIKNVVVTDMAGRFVLNQNGNLESSLAIDINGLQKGVYLLVITCSDNTQTSIRVPLN
jgi:hypothetical protein